MVEIIPPTSGLSGHIWPCKYKEITMLVIDWNIGWFTCGLGSEVGDFIMTVALFYKIKMNYSGF